MVKTTRIEIFSSTHEGLSAVGFAFHHKQLEKQMKYIKQMFLDIGHQEAEAVTPWATGNAQEGVITNLTHLGCLQPSAQKWGNWHPLYHWIEETEVGVQEGRGS